MATQQADRMLRDEMPKVYDPQAVEAAIYQFWESRGYFAPRVPDEAFARGRAAAEGGREPFTIIMPPPNVTGELHLGHALTAAIEDALTRWHRMRGDPTLWLPGTDHAGIATQIVVERELAKEGLTRHDLGRDEFIERVWMWVRKTRRRIDDQHRRLGASCDWSRNRFTMDETPQLAVRTTFKRLYDAGLIYRGTRIINWCPRCQTALSDLEVEHEEHDGFLWHIKYPLIDAEGQPTGEFIEMATTRPETIVGDVAVAVNPSDPRHIAHHGARARLPIIEREIPIVLDDAVDPAFGTGAVKVTPGHDPVDFEIGERHGLPVVNVMNADGTMNENAGKYAGLDRFEARREIVADFRYMGLLVREEPYKVSIGHCDRCDTIVEPLVSPQWYVRTGPLAEPAIAAVREGRIRIVPERFEKVYLNWMENIRDWCISRQLWWGHRIPVWYCDTCGEVTVAIETPTTCSHCGSAALRQDEDVLDTWFSSGLWTHSTLGWPHQTRDLEYFYPTSVMETGWDILFFWVARMIMLGLFNMGREPFHTVYLHGLVRDENGQKMSKSKGNVVDPLEVVDRYGADALRFALGTGSSPGNDMRFAEEKIEAGRNFCNKLWNAARFVIQRLDGPQPQPAPDAGAPQEDRWILSRVSGLAAEVNQLITDLQLGEAGRRIYDFLWGEYCDWYIEAAKVRLNRGDASPLPVLTWVLADGLKLLHPFAPFVTEAIWQSLLPFLPAGQSEALIVAAYPEADARWTDAAAERGMEALIDAVRAARNLRAEKLVDARRSVEAFVEVEDDALRSALAERAEIFEAAPTRLQPVHFVRPGEAPVQGVARAVLDATTVTLSLQGLVDVAAERAKLRKDLEQAAAQRERLQKQLGNEAFRQKAPAQVVAKLADDLATVESRVAALRKSIDELG
jgi:valyl-tRNA synthetase